MITIITGNFGLSLQGIRNKKKKRATSKFNKQKINKTKTNTTQCK